MYRSNLLEETWEVWDLEQALVTLEITESSLLEVFWNSNICISCGFWLKENSRAPRKTVFLKFLLSLILYICPANRINNNNTPGLPSSPWTFFHIDFSLHHRRLSSGVPARPLFRLLWGCLQAPGEFPLLRCFDCFCFPRVMKQYPRHTDNNQLYL